MSGGPASCVLVILSCDAYRDLWAPCLALHRRYWPDCPYPAVLVSETANPYELDAAEADGAFGAFGDHRVRSLRVGPGLTWSQVAQAALRALEAEHVLLMLDDFFLTRPVRTDVVEARRAEWVARRGAYLRLAPWPRPTGEVPGSRHLGEHERGARFRASLQAAFWRRDVLLELLRPEESAWDFEANASRRSAELAAPFYSVRAPAIPYIEALRKGRWYPRAIRLCRREGLEVDWAARGVLSVRQRIAWVGRHLRLAASGPASWRLRRALRRLVGR